MSARINEHDVAALDGWRRIEAAAREASNDVLAAHAKSFGDALAVAMLEAEALTPEG